MRNITSQEITEYRSLIDAMQSARFDPELPADCRFDSLAEKDDDNTENEG